MFHNYDLETAAQMKIKIPMMKDGHQNRPAMQKTTPIAIKHPLDSFGLIGCHSAGTSQQILKLLDCKQRQVIKSAIDYLSVYIFQFIVLSSVRSPPTLSGGITTNIRIYTIANISHIEVCRLVHKTKKASSQMPFLLNN